MGLGVIQSKTQLTMMVPPELNCLEGIKNNIRGIAKRGNKADRSNNPNIISSQRLEVCRYPVSEQLVVSTKNMTTVARCSTMEKVKKKMTVLACWQRIFMYWSSFYSTLSSYFYYCSNFAYYICWICRLVLMANTNVVKQMGIYSKNSMRCPIPWLYWHLIMSLNCSKISPPIAASIRAENTRNNILTFLNCCLVILLVLNKQSPAQEQVSREYEYISITSMMRWIFSCSYWDITHTRLNEASALMMSGIISKLQCDCFRIVSMMEQVASSQVSTDRPKMQYCLLIGTRT